MPWWSKKLEELKLCKNKLWQKYKRDMNQTNLLEYKKARAKFKREIKCSKNEAINRLGTSINPSTSTSKIWCSIRKFTGYKSSHSIHCISKADDPDTLLTDRADIADEFSKFWSKLSSDNLFSNNFNRSKSEVFNTTFHNYYQNKALYIETPITLIELTSVLKKLKGKTPGLDRISYPMIKNMPCSMKTRLLNFFNKIFANYIPQQYKVSVVIPIPKPKSQKTLLESYRPISLNGCISKVLDRIIANRLWWFIESYKLLDNRQCGFRRGKSTTDPLLYRVADM